MKTIRTLTTAFGAALLIGALTAPVFGAEVVRGRDLMTSQEWQQHRSAIQTAKTPAERQALRKTLQTTLEQRAAERGVALRHEDDLFGPSGGRNGGGNGGGNGRGRQ